MPKVVHYLGNRVQDAGLVLQARKPFNTLSLSLQSKNTTGGLLMVLVDCLLMVLVTSVRCDEKACLLVVRVGV